MLMHEVFGENLFDDFLSMPDWGNADKQLEKVLYGHHAANLMKCDVREKENCYEMQIDLPGFTKEELSADLKNGYLVITAAKGLDKDETDPETGRYIRRERYAGSCSRSFYVGKNTKSEDIRGKFENGILTLQIAKAAQQPEKPHSQVLIE